MTELRKQVRRRPSLPAGEYGFRCVLNTYKQGAKARDLPWELTDNEFRELTVKPCTYCHLVPSETRSYPVTGSISPETIAHSSYTYTGVDRVDSSQGYTIENCVPCCKRCNCAKNDMTAEAFYAWLDRISRAQYAEKLADIEQLVDDMQKRGALKVTYGDFSVEFHPNFRPAETSETIEPANPSKEEAKQAVREAFEKVKRLSKEEDEDTYWSA